MSQRKTFKILKVMAKKLLKNRTKPVKCTELKFLTKFRPVRHRLSQFGHAYRGGKGFNLLLFVLKVNYSYHSTVNKHQYGKSTNFYGVSVTVNKQILMSDVKKIVLYFSC